MGIPAARRSGRLFYSQLKTGPETSGANGLKRTDSLAVLRDDSRKMIGVQTSSNFTVYDRPPLSEASWDGTAEGLVVSVN